MKMQGGGGGGGGGYLLALVLFREQRGQGKGHYTLYVMAKLGEGTGYRALLTVGCKVCSEIAIAFYISLLLMAKYFKYKIGKYKIYQNVNQATYLIYINLLPISLPPPLAPPFGPPPAHTFLVLL